MKKIAVILIGALISISHLTKADEGMWLPILINQNMATMTEMGLQLTAEDIYNINQSSVKDAIIALDHGSCTGELISGQGLVLTNHHCGYGEIQSHSSVEHDYLSDGFWAKSKEEELSNPGKTASFLVRVEEVTERVLSQIPEGATQIERNAIVDSVASVLIKDAEKDTHFDANVEGMFKGNFYYLFVYETFEDIRLVGAPPESIGKFGADTDNWMWPRHTGDFSLFRIYSGPDGKPAPYAEENVPHKPKHFLPISLDGVQKDDYTFVMGYPGSTARYMTSFELKYTMDYENTNRAKIRGIKQDIWKADMDVNQTVRIKYASKFARSSNYWKYSITQNKALKRLKVYEKKQQLEADFTAWVNADAIRKAKYTNALSLIEQSVEETNEINSANQYLLETQLYGAETFRIAYNAGMPLMMALQTDSAEWIDSEKTLFEADMAEFFKNYNAPTDKKATAALLKLYMADVSSDLYPTYMTDVVAKKYKGNVDKFVDNLFAKSIFVDAAKLKAFIANPSAKALAKDPVYIASTSIIETYGSFIDRTADADLKMQEGMRLFVGGLLEMNPDKAYSPDANSTMRLTYGTVGDYFPADAVHYDFYTTLEGVMEKADTNVREFTVPAKLHEIYENKDYGSYGNEDGTMSVCFISNNDITGGNSGSPVINAKGHLIGTAFDGNSEAMSGDIEFENTMQKCINVDVRYVLLIIDKFAGAQNLIDEMELVKSEPQAEEANVEELESVEAN